VCLTYNLLIYTITILIDHRLNTSALCRCNIYRKKLDMNWIDG